MISDLPEFIDFSAKRALSDTITPYVLGITISYNKDLMVFRVYFEPEATDEDKELLDDAMGEMAADLWQEIAFFEYQPIVIESGEKMEPLMEWLYVRDKT